MTALTTLTANIAKTFNMGDGSGLVETLKATAFKSATAVSDAQMTALLIVASQYGLNPFTREIFAFPDKGGIVPVVGLDGWSRIINSHAQFDGMDFEQDAESCTCIIYRKDRNHPIKVTEWMAECKRGTQPWASHPRRMLRHKAMIQCARLAFGFVGIFDQDEAERIVNPAPSIDAETGEIITFDVTAALELVKKAQTVETLNEVYAAEGGKAEAAKDKAGYQALRQACRDRKAAIEASMVVDMPEAEEVSQ